MLVSDELDESVAPTVLSTPPPESGGDAIVESMPVLVSTAPPASLAGGAVPVGAAVVVDVVVGAGAAPDEGRGRQQVPLVHAYGNVSPHCVAAVAPGPLATRHVPPKLSQVLELGPGPTHAMLAAIHTAMQDAMTARPRNDAETSRTTLARMGAHYAQEGPWVNLSQTIFPRHRGIVLVRLDGGPRARAC
jgi:hypothetical protein